MSFNGGRVSGSENLEIVPVCMRRRMRRFKSVCVQRVVHAQACVSARAYKQRSYTVHGGTCARRRLGRRARARDVHVRVRGAGEQEYGGLVHVCERVVAGASE
jgi:hypothetical protein